MLEEKTTIVEGNEKKEGVQQEEELPNNLSKFGSEIITEIKDHRDDVQREGEGLLLCLGDQNIRESTEEINRTGIWKKAKVIAQSAIDKIKSIIGNSGEITRDDFALRKTVEKSEAVMKDSDMCKTKRNNSLIPLTRVELKKTSVTNSSEENKPIENRDRDSYTEYLLEKQRNKMLESLYQKMVQDIQKCDIKPVKGETKEEKYERESEIKTKENEIYNKYVLEVVDIYSNFDSKKGKSPRKIADRAERDYYRMLDKFREGEISNQDILNAHISMEEARINYNISVINSLEMSKTYIRKEENVTQGKIREIDAQILEAQRYGENTENLAVNRSNLEKNIRYYQDWILENNERQQKISSEIISTRSSIDRMKKSMDKEINSENEELTI